MKTNNENRQKLLNELIEQSAKIDELVVKSRQAAENEKFIFEQELGELRAKQREITEKLHAMEEHGHNAWENIGDGG
jgi:hypothetical protein